MHEVDFLCLAVSRRDGGNCIAGIDLNSGKWIRPINSKTDGAFGDHEIFVSEVGVRQPRIMELLDVLHLQIDRYVGENAQPENWETAPASYENPYLALRKFDRRDDLLKLRYYLDRNRLLLHSLSERVPESEIRFHKLTHSLSLIHPNRLHWRVLEHPANPARLQVRADFTFEQNAYNLVVTDPVWEATCRRFGKGRHSHSSILGQENRQILLAVSLAAKPIRGWHYKLVAGVINLPA